MIKPFLSAAFTSALIAAPVLAQGASAPTLQPISRATFMDRLDNAFVGADANKDGFLDRAEIESAEAKAMAARKALGLKQREAAFRRLDTNKDGKISLAENRAPTMAQFDRADSNKDGTLSVEEQKKPRR